MAAPPATPPPTPPCSPAEAAPRHTPTSSHKPHPPWPRHPPGGPRRGRRLALFAAVMCEDIERSGQDTFNALKLERQLGDAGVPLFATDEPISVEGMNATTILVRRVKQGIAEWLRYQIKEKVWRGFEQHTIDGYNMGTPPHGYTGQKIPHPVPMKAAQGRTKTLLVLDPPKDKAVADIYGWRTVDKRGINTIVNKLNANPAAYPAPNGRGWTVSTVTAILANPKYTGYQVFGRRRRSLGPSPQHNRVVVALVTTIAGRAPVPAAPAAS